MRGIRTATLLGPTRSGRSRPRQLFATLASVGVHALLLLSTPQCREPQAPVVGGAPLRLVSAGAPVPVGRFETAAAATQGAGPPAGPSVDGVDGADDGEGAADLLAPGDGGGDGDEDGADDVGTTPAPRSVDTTAPVGPAAAAPASADVEAHGPPTAGGVLTSPSSAAPVGVAAPPPSAADPANRANGANRAAAAPPDAAAAAAGATPRDDGPDAEAAAAGAARSADAAAQGDPSDEATRAAADASAAGVPVAPDALADAASGEPDPAAPDAPGGGAEADVSDPPDASPVADASTAAPPVPAEIQAPLPPEVRALPPDAATLFAALAALDREAAADARTEASPAPPKPPPPPETRWLTWVRISAALAEIEASPESRLIAAWNVHVDDPATTRVTAAAEGPRRTGAAAHEPKPFQVGVVTPRQPPRDALGDDPTIPRPTTAAARTPATSSPGGAGTPASSGLPPRAAAAAVASAAAVRGHPGQAGTSGDPGAAGAAGATGGAEWVPPVDPVDHWSPSVGRLEVTSRTASPSRPALPATPTTPETVAREARHARLATSSRQSRPSTPSPPPATSESEDPTPVEPVPDPIDWMTDLQDLLAWGREASDLYSPREAIEGTQGALSTDDTSPQTLLLEAPVHDTPAVSARQTPVGRYLQLVDDEVRTRWSSFPLTPEQLAFGTTTFATVQFTVLRSGRVEAARLVRRSQDPTLDQLALAAIPRRLPRIPHDVPTDTIEHRVHLWYRKAEGGP